MTDRVLKINPGHYDQVVALTQAMINSGLENLFLAKTPDPPQPSTISSRGTGSMKDVILQAPRVILSTNSTNFSQVIYVMGFRSGRLAVYNNPDPKVETMTDYDMKNWRFAFSIDLGISKLDPTDSKYQEIRAKINQPGNYTIMQLLLDISTAGITEFREELSSFGTTIWKNETDETKVNFGNLVRKFLGEIFKIGLNNVGYVAATDGGPTGDHPPTFLPTDVKFQSYPWIGKPPNNQPISGLTGNAVLNYLCYLEMTDNRPPPTDLSATYLKIDGNWTDGDTSNVSSMDLGTFCLSKRNFLDRWLLPKLRAMNQIMEPTVKTIPVSCKVDGVWLYYSCNPDLRLGNNPYHPKLSDSHFDWKPADPYTVTADIPGVISKGTYNCYQFTSSYVAPNSFDLAGLNGALAKVWGSAECTCTNRLLYKAGSSQIILLGYAYLHSYFSLWSPLWQGPTSKDDTIKYTYNWSVVFNLESVKDGGLQVTSKVGMTTPIKELSLDQGIGNLLVKYFDQAFPIATRRFTSFQEDLVAALAGQQKFYFPASGTFFFKNPVLNYQGDLIASVGYNGTDSPIPGVADRSQVRNTTQTLPPDPKGLNSSTQKNNG